MSDLPADLSNYDWASMITARVEGVQEAGVSASTEALVGAEIAMQLSWLNDHMIAANTLALIPLLQSHSLIDESDVRRMLIGLDNRHGYTDLLKPPGE